MGIFVKIMKKKIANDFKTAHGKNGNIERFKWEKSPFWLLNTWLNRVPHLNSQNTKRKFFAIANIEDKIFQRIKKNKNSVQNHNYLAFEIQDYVEYYLDFEHSGGEPNQN